MSLIKFFGGLDSKETSEDRLFNYDDLITKRDKMKSICVMILSCIGLFYVLLVCIGLFSL